MKDIPKLISWNSNLGQLESDIVIEHDSWVAARVSSEARDSYFQPVFAHTSPVYLRTGSDGPHKRVAAEYFVKEIDESIEIVRKKGKFYTDSQRNEITELFREGQEVYKRMLT